MLTPVDKQNQKRLKLNGQKTNLELSVPWLWPEYCQHLERYHNTSMLFVAEADEPNPHLNAKKKNGMECFLHLSFLSWYNHVNFSENHEIDSKLQISGYQEKKTLK